ncbi:HAD family hydrolase [Demequina globuliformis]|uniref:HAD hydrolase family protein n=1 Tax=Demequina globuliformis TaxID=676202 RepID=UPI000781F80C|nr:HAD family hydrolase [Demequina globuliformis]
MAIHPRAIFLDVDGTYAEHGVVPQAHADAVRRARARGNFVFLCTGRPACAISPQLVDAGFDGIVSSAGARVQVGDAVVTDERFPADIARRTVEALDAQGALYALEAPDAMYAGPEVEALLDAKAPGPHAPRERQEAFSIFRAALTVTEDRASRSFSKIFVFDGGGPIAAVLEAVGPEISVVAGSNEALGERTGEIYLTHITKAVGVDLARSALGLGADAVVAAGDGPNDREMLAEAHTSIVISTAVPDILELADVVADGPERAGLVRAFAELDLI